jgi:hypothetical protein
MVKTAGNPNLLTFALVGRAVELGLPHANFHKVRRFAALADSDLQAG